MSDKLPGLGGPMGADHGPIQAEYHDIMNALAVAIDEMLNPGRKPDEERTTGFFLTVFAFGDAGNPKAGRFNYISNADKLDVRAMVKEVGARLDARLSPGGRA